MTRQEKAQAKRERRAARNTVYIGAFSAVLPKTATRFGGRPHGDAPPAPTFASLLAGLMRLGRRDPKTGIVVLGLDGLDFTVARAAKGGP